MAGAAQDAGDDAIVAINVTPLVDVTLVLLVILMVTMPFLVTPQTLPMDLPKVSSGAPGEKQVLLTVELGENGDLAIDKQRIGKEEGDAAVLRRAKAAHDANPELRAVINADAKVQHGRIMSIIGMLRQAGVQKIAFGVMPVQAGGAGTTPSPTPSK
jgi:biopolymer transport protein ExbD